MLIASGPVRAKPDASAPAQQRPWYDAKEMAVICGVDVDCVYRRAWRQKQQARNRMPAPYMDSPLRWDRIAVDAWRRPQPGLPAQPPANDDAPAQQAVDDAEQRARFHAVYGSRT